MARTIVSLAVALSLAGCGGGDGGPGQLTTKQGQQNFFWEYCLDFATTLTGLAESENETLRAAGDPVDCPGGGVVSYNATTGVATLDDCGGSGAIVNGTLNLTLLDRQEAHIAGGTLTIDGAFEGSVSVNSGYMAWEVPVQDATTYWELRVNIDDSEVCIWSGADHGECPDPF